MWIYSLRLNYFQHSSPSTNHVHFMLLTGYGLYNWFSLIRRVKEHLFSCFSKWKYITVNKIFFILTPPWWKKTSCKVLDLRDFLKTQALLKQTVRDIKILLSDRSVSLMKWNFPGSPGDWLCLDCERNQD